MTYVGILIGLILLSYDNTLKMAHVWLNMSSSLKGRAYCFTAYASEQLVIVENVSDWREKKIKI